MIRLTLVKTPQDDRRRHETMRRDPRSNDRARQGVHVPIHVGMRSRCHIDAAARPYLPQLTYRWPARTMTVGRVVRSLT